MTTCSFCGREIDSEPIRDNGEVFCSRGCQQGETRTSGAHIEHTPETTQQTDGETAYFSISGMHTHACESYLERRAVTLDGVNGASASYTAEMMRVSYDPEAVERDTIEDTLSAWGYRASAPTPEETPADRNDFDFDHLRTIFSVIAVAPIYIIYAAFFYPVYLGLLPTSSLDNHAIVTGLYGPVAMFTTITIFGVGFPILRSAYISLHERQLTVDVLISITAVSAYAYSMVSLLYLDRLYLFFDIATAVIVLATIGNHARARYKRQAVEDLTEFVDETETAARRLLEDGTTTVVPPEDCTTGDRLLVRPGERIPLDGTIVDGRGTVNEALITGEARPQRKVVGDTVIGGSIAADGSFEITVDEGATSTLDRLRDLVWDLQTEQSPAERLTNRVTAIYIPVVCVFALVTLGAWTVAGAPAEPALRTALTVLIIACPVSLSLVTPLAVGRGLSTAAERDVPVFDQTILERVTDADVIAFDKTGTLTTGEMRVAAVHAVEECDSKAVLRRAAAVESRSSHPIAAAIRDRAPDRSQAVTSFERYRYGVVADVDASRTAVGNPALFDDLNWSIPEAIRDTIDRVRDRGELPTVVGWEGTATGVITLEDQPREKWTETVAELAADDRQIVVITGDDSRVARQFEAHPDVSKVYADVPPEAKEELVRRLRDEGVVAMVGDGTNDAPALAAADLGVAMVSGSDFTVTVADALVTADDLTPFRDLFGIARGTRRRLLENLGLALTVPAIGVPLAAVGFVTPLVATTLMATGTILVLANSYRPLTSNLC
ncbi:Cu2+-exporting ATPase [Halarchaeum rubridurum]|uniref:Cu2+-exporting ATPase n=1 Tax=Halarchaeum rubridurum TaxID=489911 RepID=A0A830G470_9EURY|nr:heavy metal translocating P-type ATPase [Halarchaeum rubridurum]MBP1956005.1 Cu2+-exporting ATPase [Halarchaeum rubridurum]GGM73756.1 heavy metal translocating P-type ATPase [Halarchaeum rubridurum]